MAPWSRVWSVMSLTVTDTEEFGDALTFSILKKHDCIFGRLRMSNNQNC